MDDLNTNIVDNEELSDIINESNNEKISEDLSDSDILNYVQFNDKTVETIILTAGRQFAKIQKVSDIESFAKQYKNEVWGWLEMFGFKQELQKIRIKNIPGWMKLLICTGILVVHGFTVQIPEVEK